MSRNHRFILELAARHQPPPARLLDFGCGAGEVVGLALQAGYDAWGVDTFDTVWQQYGHAAGAHGGRIVHAPAGAPFPFGDASFNIVVTNQVFEHIETPAPVLRELTRVLRPHGLLVAIFPTREVVIEPHLQAPFVHWFRTGSPAQARALRLCHTLGFCNDPGRVPSAWVAEEMNALRQHMFYRRARDALAMFAPGFRLIERGEADFIADRICHSAALRWSHGVLSRPVFAPVLRLACLRLAGVVLVLRVRAAGDAAR